VDTHKIWAHFQKSYPDTFEGAEPRLGYILRDIFRKTEAPVPRVLNIGAGNGFFEASAQQRGWDIHALDPDEQTVDTLSAKNIKAYRGGIEKMPFDDGAFDFVVASEVLEHLKDDPLDSGIKEVFRVLNDRGYFIGTVPYCEDLSMNVVVCPRCEAHFHRWGHEQSFDADALKARLSVHFPDIRIKRKAFVRFGGHGLWGIFEGMVRIVLAKYGVRIASTNLYFVARR
jgi:SAM-dependent methyltransferase